ncbi:MAG TPA: MerR family transcriptional regulator, partial [Chitinophagaceae bacterium]|nr:MerR family transcriptional regulator [Chitinophagaceae bacterium]
PAKDLEFVANFKKPDYIYTHLTSRPRNFNLDKFIHRFTLHVSGIPLVISGSLAASQSAKTRANVHFKTSLGEVQEFISTL